MTNSCKLNGDRDVNDYYGFTKDYDRTKDSQIKLKKNSDFGLKKKKKSSKKFWIILISVVVAIYFSMSVIAAYIAWNEFPKDIVINKSIKSYIAFIFSPIYLLYYFIKTTLFTSLKQE